MWPFKPLRKVPTPVEYVEINLAPTDFLVIESEKVMTFEQREKLAEAFKNALENDTYRVAVLDSGMKLKVLHR